MENAPLVGRVKGAGNLTGHAQRILDGHRTAKHVALHVLENEIPRPDIVELADVRMVQSRNRTRFLLEPSESIAIERERLGQHFDGNVASKARIPRPIDLAHPAGAQQGDDFKRSEPGARGERHAETILVAGEAGDPPYLDAAQWVEINL
jgi:hypothetical protein